MESKKNLMDQLFAGEADFTKDLFGMNEDFARVELVELEKLIPYPEHIFRLYTGERLENMIESIKEHGIITPVIVRDLRNGKFEILAGHNRINAAKKAGLDKAPCVVKTDPSEEEIAAYVYETNLFQRSLKDMSYSERAKSLFVHYERIRKKGKRKEMLDEIKKAGEEIDAGSARDELAGEYELSSRQLAKYIKVASLTDGMLALLDAGTLHFTAAYLLSFVEDDALQEVILDALQSKEVTCDIKKAQQLKERYQQNQLKEEMVLDILAGKKKKSPAKKKKKLVFVVEEDIKERYFSKDCKEEEVNQVILEALSFYFANKKGGETD